jgi:hypothetical protein
VRFQFTIITISILFFIIIILIIDLIVFRVQGVSWLAKYCGMTRVDAVALGQMLLQRDLLRHIHYR